MIPQSKYMRVRIINEKLNRVSRFFFITGFFF